MINFILAQVTLTGDSTVPNIPSSGAEITVKSISYWDMIGKGGPVMIAMGILSVLLIYLFVERLLVILKATKQDSNLVPAVKEMMLNGNIEGARNLCKTNASPVARMIEKGISRLGKPVNEIESAMESAGKIELNKVERNLGYLSTIAAVAPLFGFVGTIFGVITIFYNISQTGDFGIQTISEGLYQKMVTSAAGIIIGILAFISHHFLHNMIERLVAKMEEASLKFLDIISEPGA